MFVSTSKLAVPPRTSTGVGVRLSADWANVEVFADTRAVTAIAKIVVTCVRFAIVFLLPFSDYIAARSVRTHQWRQNFIRRKDRKA
jgi:hypothetical protein